MSDGIGIYKIESPSGKCYVGMTTDSFDSRWRNHLKDLRSGRHKCRALQRAFVKYGEMALVFSVLEEVDRSSSDLSILERERYWWDELSKMGILLYNGRPTGTGSVHHTLETRQLISIAITRSHGLSPRGCKGCETVIEKPRPSQMFCSISCSRSKVSYSDSQIISELYLSGLSLRKVAVQVGVSHITVRKILIKADVPLRSR